MTASYQDAFDRFGRRALALVVASAILGAVGMSHAPVTAPANLGIVLLGALYLGILVVGGDRLRPSAARPWLIAYFGLQLALAAAMLALQARLDSFGVVWMVLLPLLAQGLRVLSRGAMSILIAAIFLLPIGHLSLLAGAREALAAALGIGAGIVFVLLFSAATLRESSARARSEALSADLARANQRLAELYASADEVAAVRERNRLAREIHDTLGHTLTVINVQLESAKLLVASTPAEALRRIDQAAALAREGLAEVRRSVGALRAGPLDGRSLEEAITRLCRAGACDGMVPQLEVLGEGRALAAEPAEALLRVAQEAVTNVRRHAAARTARVTLDYRHPGLVSLSVSDDGCGAATTEAGGFGLLGIRERVQLAGGGMEIETAPGRGFRLAVEVPA